MKVVQINAVYGMGSTGVIVKDIGDMLYKNGHKCYFVYQQTNDDISTGYKMGNYLDWKLHALGTRLLGKQGYFSCKSTNKLCTYLDKINPDIVHLHNLHSNYINLNMLLDYLSRKDIATVITLHDCWFFTGKCFHFINVKCEKWRYKCSNCPQNKNDVKSLFFDQSEKVFNDKLYHFGNISNLTIVGCSDWITHLAESSPIFKGKMFERIYNGVDTSIFRYTFDYTLAKKYSLKNKFVILGMANKWLQSNNHDFVNQILNSLDDQDIILLVGCTDDQIRQLSQYSNIITLGYIYDREFLAKIYSLSNVFVNLTFEDTLPTVNMEAICCGTPVITYDSCGSPELIEEDKTGYVISQKNIHEFRTVISKIKNGKISRCDCEKIGQYTFDKNKQYLKYLGLYKNILMKESDV